MIKLSPPFVLNFKVCEELLSLPNVLLPVYIAYQNTVDGKNGWALVFTKGLLIVYFWKIICMCTRLGKGSVGKVPAVRAWGPEFRSLAPMQKSGIVLHVCNSKAGGTEEASQSQGERGLNTTECLNTCTLSGKQTHVHTLLLTQW